MATQKSSSTTDLPLATDDTAGSKTSPAKVLPRTSSSAFQASDFGKLATGSSPFASLGTTQSSIFASPAAASTLPPTSVFSAPGSQLPPSTMPKLTFGSANSASPFASLASGINGAGLGSPFAASKGLDSFASPMAKQVQSERPAKPFGAPESDEESGDEADAVADDEPEPSEQEGATPLEKESEEKKKIKLHKGEKRPYCEFFFYSFKVGGLIWIML